MRHSTSVHVSAPPAVVWQTMVDLESWPDWIPTVESIDVGDGGLRPGLRVRLKQVKLAAADYVVESVDGYRFSWVSRPPGVRVWADHRISEAPGGSSVELVFEMSGAVGSLLGLLSGAKIRRYVESEGESLKRESERRATLE